MKVQQIKIDGKPLSMFEKKMFVNIYGVIYDSVVFDNAENELNLSDSDIELIAHNSAYNILTSLLRSIFNPT